MLNWNYKVVSDNINRAKQNYQANKLPGAGLAGAETEGVWKWVRPSY
jgi:hypothetical protein